MKNSLQRALKWAAVCSSLGALAYLVPGCGHKDDGKIKIGYLVKQPEEPYFNAELAAAKKAADENGIDLLTPPARNGNEVMTSLDVLASKGAKGFVLCTPDPKLGPAIVRKAKELGLQIMTVDDQFLDADGKIMNEVHHLGMDAREIGKQAAQVELAEMKKRGWDLKETAICVSSFRELDTARQRLDGEAEIFKSAGFTDSQFFDAPNHKTDLPSAHDACYAKFSSHPDVKHWLISGMNDNAVLGAVRATEDLSISPDNVIAVGINGTESEGEFAKPKPTGYIASMLLFPNEHGYRTTNMVYRWVKDGTEPPMLTLIPTATIMTRENYKQALAEHGLAK